MGGYRFSSGRTNQKRHETHKTCSPIRTLASKIFIRKAVSWPTDMRPPRRHSVTTSRGTPSCRGGLSRFFLNFYFCLKIPPPSWTSYWGEVGSRSLHTPRLGLDLDLPYGTVCTTLYVVAPSLTRPYTTWTVPSTSQERRRGGTELQSLPPHPWPRTRIGRNFVGDSFSCLIGVFFISNCMIA